MKVLVPFKAFPDQVPVSCRPVPEGLDDFGVLRAAGNAYDVPRFVHGGYCPFFVSNDLQQL